jgi:hypothetical protein
MAKENRSRGYDRVAGALANLGHEVSGQTAPLGAQHGRGRFIRPNRASSANTIRKGRPWQLQDDEPWSPQRGAFF